MTNWEELNMLNKFKYKGWTFVEHINPKKIVKGFKSDGVYDTGGRIGPYDAIYKSGTNEKQIYDRIIDWFKHVEPSLPDADEVWDALDEVEAGEWFKNSKRQFMKWWDSLSTKLKHYYVDRLESGKSLLPDELPGIPDIPKETNHLKMTIVNDKLALSSSEKDVLDRAKEMIEAVRGSSKYEYRTTRNSMGEKIHTYIFDLKQ